MPAYQETSFTLHSVDHDRVLLDSSTHSTRSLLGADERTPEKLKLSFELNGETRENVLVRSKGAFADDATVTFMGKEGGETVTVPETFAYYSADRDWILTFHGEGKFDGLVYENNGASLFHFVAENGVMKVNGSAEKYFPGMKSNRKLTSEANGIDYWDDCHAAQSSGLGSMDLGILIGNVFWQNFEDDVFEEMNSYITLSNTIYERQMDISLTIKDTLVAKEPDTTNFLPGRCSVDIQTQLQRMARWTPPSEQVLWHLLEDCFGSSGGILGIAYLGTLCSNNNVGVSYYSDDRYDEDEYPTWATVAHELGHNFDGQHSFEEGQGRTGGIMDYGFLRNKLINGEVQFNSQYREREVCREVDRAVSRGCINEGIAPSPTADFTRPVSGSREIFATSERRINCAKHVHKMPSTGDHIKKFSGKNRVECQKECAIRENCSGFVFNREDGWCELMDEVLSVDTLKYTAEFNTFVCFEGTIPERFVARGEDDALENVDSEEIKQECCSEEVDQGFMGLNLNYREGLSQEECESECVKNSKCEGTTYNPEQTSCMLFGGHDFSRLLGEYTGATSLSCNRGCISNRLDIDNSSTSDVDSGFFVVFGAMVLLVGVIAAVAGFSNRKVKDTTDGNNKEGTVYQATL